MTHSHTLKGGVFNKEMEKTIEIQKRITITKKEFQEVIDRYRNMPSTFGMGYNGKSMNKE